MNSLDTRILDEGASAELHDLLRRAEQGDEAVLPALRELFDCRPDMWQALSDLTAHAERALIQEAARGNLLVREALFRRLAALRAELAGPSPSSRRRLLAAWVVLCWLHVHVAELDALACRQDGHADESRLRQSRRRLNRARRLYIMAHRQLAMLAMTQPVPAAYESATSPVD